MFNSYTLASCTTPFVSEVTVLVGIWTLARCDEEIQFVTGNEWNAGNLSYHLKSRPKWESFTNDELLNKSSQFICVDDVCLGRY